MNIAMVAATDVAASPDAPLLRVLLSPITWLGLVMIVPPAAVLLLLTYGAWRRYRRTHAAVWRATVWGLSAALFVFVAFSVSICHDVGASHRSTAIVGVVAIPFAALPFSLMVLLVVWSVAVLVLGWRPRRTVSVAPDEPAAPPVPSGAVAMAILILIGIGGLAGANAYTAHLVSLSAQTSSPDALRRLAHGTWARMDSRVLVAVARNDAIPEDLIRELSRRSNDVQTALAYNRRTPSEVMVEMSKTNWSAARILDQLSKAGRPQPSARPGASTQSP